MLTTRLAARFFEQLSTITATFEDQELFDRLKKTLIRYITQHYITLIDSAGHTEIFHKDTRVTYLEHEHEQDITDDDFEGDHGCDCEDEASCGHEPTDGFIRWGVLAKDRVHACHPHDFDIVTAVTQGSINTHFRTIWETARRKVTSLGTRLRTYSSTELELETCLSEYSVVHPDHGDEVFFTASFGAPQVQLVCSEGSHSVVFYLLLQEGRLKTLDSHKHLNHG